MRNLEKCRELLEQTETRVSDLYFAASHPIEQSRMAEALSFLKAALIAVRQIPERVTKLPQTEARTTGNSLRAERNFTH